MTELKGREETVVTVDECRHHRTAVLLSVQLSYWLVCGILFWFLECWQVSILNEIQTLECKLSVI